MEKRSDLDKWLMRSKDLIIVGGAVWASLVFGVNFYNLPGVVANQALRINEAHASIIELRETNNAFDKRLAAIEMSQGYTNKGIDEIKGWLKSISNRTTRENNKPWGN